MASKFGDEEIGTEGVSKFGDSPAEQPRASFASTILQAYKHAGESIARGYMGSISEFYNTGANALLLVNKASDWLEENTGIGHDTAFSMAEQYLRNVAREKAPRGQATDVVGAIYEAIGAAPVTIAEYMAGARALGPVIGLASVDALKTADKGPKEAAVAAAQGALTGGILHGAASLGRIERSLAMGGVGAIQGGALAGDMPGAVAGAVTMGGLGALSPGGPATLRATQRPSEPAPATARPIAEAKPAQDIALPPLGKPRPEEIVEAQFGGEKYVSQNLNTERLAAPDEIKAALALVGQSYKRQITKARRDVVTHEATIALAQSLGMTPETLLQRRRGQALNAHEALAARQLLVDSTRILFDAGKAAALTKAPGDLYRYYAALTRHVAIQEQVTGGAAEAGRALEALKIPAEEGASRLRAINNIIKQEGVENITKTAEMIAQLDSEEQIMRFARDAYKPKASDYLLEAWINSLLSGPRTHVVNITSNALVTLWTMPENMLAAALGTLGPRGRDRVYFRDALARMYGAIEGAREGVRLGAKALRTEEPTDPLSKIETRRHRAIPGVVGRIVRLPGRFLMAEDEFFKAIGYRMELNALAYRDGIKKGLSDQALTDYVEGVRQTPPEDFHLRSIEAARYQTFTKELGPIAGSLSKMAQAAPLFRVVMPFIRTPTNIVKFFFERTPLAPLSKEVRADLRAGGARRDVAAARILLGSMAMGAIAGAAHSGMITGGGPQEPSSRQLWLEDHQPYSIKIGDKWYAYGRLEPMGMLFGIAADYADISGQIEEREADEIAAMVVTSISKNLVSKTWLSGLSELIEVMSDPDRYGDRYVQNLLGTLVPTGVAHVAREMDPTLRYVDSTLAKLKSRLPGWSATLPPRLNIWGEPIVLEGGLGPDLISPVFEKTDKNNPVTDEMIRLDLHPSMPQRKLGGIDLEPEIYNEYVILSGKPTKLFLSAIMSTPEYRALFDSEKAAMIERAFSDYRDLARDLLRIRHPDLWKKEVMFELEQIFEQKKKR